MRTLTHVLAATAMLAGCGILPINESPAPDAGPAIVQDAGPFEGPTIGGAIPGTPGPSEPTVTDAGEEFEPEKCCAYTFAIADQEAETTSGFVLGTSSAIAPPGLALTRANGQWNATACLPLGVPVYYWFSFETPVPGEPGPVDAGLEDPEAGPPDAGSAPPPVETVERVSDLQPTTTNAAGANVNVYGPVENCDR